jgi:hypothetical protein
LFAKAHVVPTHFEEIMQTLLGLTTKSERAVRLAFAKADSRIAEIEDTRVRRGAPAAQRLTAAIKSASADPIKTAAAIKSELDAEIDAAFAIVERAAHEADGLDAVCQYIKTGGVLDVADPTLHALAKQLRAAHLAGALDGVAVTSQVERYLNLTRDEIKRLADKWVAQTKSAAQITATRAELTAHQRAGLDCEHLERRLVQQKAAHNWTYGNKRGAK